MSKRNAHAVAARARKAGPHKDAPKEYCDECGMEMGYGCPSYVCAPCELGYESAYGLEQYLEDEVPERES